MRDGEVDDISNADHYDDRYQQSDGYGQVDRIGLWGTDQHDCIDHLVCCLRDSCPYCLDRSIVRVCLRQGSVYAGAVPYRLDSLVLCISIPGPEGISPLDCVLLIVNEGRAGIVRLQYGACVAHLGGAGKLVELRIVCERGCKSLFVIGDDVQECLCLACGMESLSPVLFARYIEQVQTPLQCQPGVRRIFHHTHAYLRDLAARALRIEKSATQNRDHNAGYNRR